MDASYDEASSEAFVKSYCDEHLIQTSLELKQRFWELFYKAWNKEHNRREDLKGIKAGFVACVLEGILTDEGCVGFIMHVEEVRRGCCGL